MRAIFDTGSTNTWILNKNTDLGEGRVKEFFYDDSASKTNVKTKKGAGIMFGSGALQGHFYKDDIRIGGCKDGQIHIPN